MSLAEVLQKLPTLSVVERPVLMRRTLELDEPGWPPAEEDLIEHRNDPGSALSLVEMPARVRSQTGN
jgi:hypothetical protein